MEKKNSVFIATSIDGFIADAEGGIDWLESVPELNQIDTGYVAFTQEIDALFMGRKTYEKVLSFGIDWPYQKPVFVASRTLEEIPAELQDKVFLLSGNLDDMIQKIHAYGFGRLYIDGGNLIQQFLRKDLIDEMIITVIPVLLGSGFPLFAELSEQRQFDCVEVKHFLGKVAQNRFIRKRDLAVNG